MRKKKKSMPRLFCNIAPVLYGYCWAVMIVWLQKEIYKMPLRQCILPASLMALIADLGLSVLACVAVWMDRVWGDRV